MASLSAKICSGAATKEGAKPHHSLRTYLFWRNGGEGMMWLMRGPAMVICSYTFDIGDAATSLATDGVISLLSSHIE